METYENKFPAQQGKWGGSMQRNSNSRNGRGGGYGNHNSSNKRSFTSSFNSNTNGDVQNKKIKFEQCDRATLQLHFITG